MTTNELLTALSAWIDDANTTRDPEAVTWGRLAKIAEESGEVIAAYIGATGQNPRKGVTGTTDAVVEELLDVAVTALCAVVHLTENDPDHDVMNALAFKIEEVADRAGLTAVTR
jgi:hypothetical protein